MSFGDGIAAVQVWREEKYGKVIAWLLLLLDFAVVGMILALFLGIFSILTDWAMGKDTLVHVVRANLAWIWELLHRIG